MDIAGFLAGIAIVLTGMGYGFKKSWLLWLSVPFWLVMGIYIGFFQDWFNNLTAQHSLILIGVAASIAVMITALRMQMASLSNPATNLDGDDELDDDDLEFGKEYAQYQKNSKIYQSKRKQRR